MTNVAYPKLTLAENIFKDIVWDVAVESGIGALFSYVPFLRLPIISSIVRTCIKYYANMLFEVVRLSIDLSAIRLTNEKHKADFGRAATALTVIARTKGIESNEFKSARDNARASLAKYSRYSG